MRYFLVMMGLLWAVFSAGGQDDERWVLFENQYGAALENPVTGERTEFESGFSWQWSPDGAKLLFRDRVDDTDEGSPIDLFMLDIATMEVQRVTDLPGSDGNMVWSPSGRQFAWVNGAPAKGATLWVAQADGSEQRALFQFEGYGANPAWAADEQYLAVQDTDTRTSYPQLRVLSIEGEMLLLLEGTTAAAWSPLENVLAYMAAPDEENGIYLLNIPGQRENAQFISTNIEGGRSGAPKWSPDGRWLLFFTYPHGESRAVVNLYEAETEMLRDVPIAENLEVSSVSWSPDSQSLALGGRRLPLEDPPRHDLYVYGVTGGEMVKRAEFQHPGYLDTIRWSPDGSELFVSVYHGGDGFEDAWNYRVRADTATYLPEVWNLQWQP